MGRTEPQRTCVQRHRLSRADLHVSLFKPIHPVGATNCAHSGFNQKRNIMAIWTVTPNPVQNKPAPLFFSCRFVFVLTFLQLQRDAPWFCVFFSQTLSKVALSLFALCLRRRYTADPHAAFCHSMSEENIWGSRNHSSFFSSSHMLFVHLSNTTVFFIYFLAQTPEILSA